MTSIDLYGYIKLVHVSTAMLSVSGFILRFALLRLKHRVMGERWVRIVPHINDTILLAAAIWLTLIVHQYPVTHHWLTAKLIGLVAYVVFGAFALYRGETEKQKWFCFFGALLAVAYIAGAAITHSAWSWLIFA